MNTQLIFASIAVFLSVMLILVIVLLVAKKYLVPSGNVKLTINGENNFPLQVFRKGKPLAGWENPRMPVNFKHIHEAVAARFIDCLETGQAFPSTLEDGYAALRLILAAYKSAKENRTVAMEEI